MLQIPDVISFAPSTVPFPIIENEMEKKKLFGTALGQGKNPFEAALSACGDNTNQALYISQRWLNDPVVVASKDLYLKTVYNADELLDADQLAAKLLEMAEERNANNTFYMLEGKDRLAALKLYAEVKGIIGKTAVDQSTKNFTYNSMKVTFVSPDKKDDKIIDQSPNEEKLLNTKLPPLKLKLVSA